MAYKNTPVARAYHYLPIPGTHPLALKGAIVKPAQKIGTVGGIQLHPTVAAHFQAFTMAKRSFVSKRFERISRSWRPIGPLSNGETAKVLRFLLLSLFTWNGFWTIALLRYSTGHPPQLSAITIVEAALAAALFTLRRGSFRAASWIYLGGIWLFATIVIFQNGGIRSVVLTLYVTLPVSAAWLLGYNETVDSCRLPCLSLGFRGLRDCRRKAASHDSRHADWNMDSTCGCRFDVHNTGGPGAANAHSSIGESGRTV
jgi:hypothetical protein